MKIEDMVEEIKPIVWCTGALDEIIKLGLVEGGGFEIPVNLLATFDQLDSQFSPTDDEIINFTRFLKVREGLRKHTILFLILFRDDREGMREYVRKYKENN